MKHAFITIADIAARVNRHPSVVRLEVRRRYPDALGRIERLETGAGYWRVRDDLADEIAAQWSTVRKVGAPFGKRTLRA